MKNTYKRLLNIIGAACIVLLFQPAHAALFEVNDVPLYVLEGVGPNVILTMDDSGSMYWSYMPDNIHWQLNTRRAKSSSFNQMYYDPTTHYLPPVDENGATLGDASFSGAWNDGLNRGDCTINLATSYRPTWYYGNNCDGWDSSREYAGGAEAAYYYLFDAHNSDTNCNSTVNDDDCYDKVIVSTSSGPDSSDERSNFANWYSYYRKRFYLTKTAASRAFANLSSDFRLAHQTINGGGSNNLTSVEKYTGTARTSFFNWLFDVPASGGTPLRAGIKRAGDYLSTAEPYRDDPGDSSTPERACRQNFQVMMTDGYWNSTAGVSGNVDNQNHTLPDNEYNITSYTPKAPYKDNNSAFLADNAFYYWAKDLRPLLDNKVSTSMTDLSSDINGDSTVDNSDIFWNPKNNPANWQHMVTYTIGMGLDGQLAFPGDYSDLLSGDKSWSNDHIDDLWHAAINSRGKYFSASNASEMVKSFADIVGNIIDRTGSSAAVSLNSGSIQSNSRVFQARFDTNGWNGHLLSKSISTGSNCGSVPIGTICQTIWDAACSLDGGTCEATGTNVNAQSTRRIVTMNSSTNLGVAFGWDSLSTAQQDQLRDPDGSSGTATQGTVQYGKDVLNFIRGEHQLEASNGGTFRNRTSKLGDIIQSNPIYVGPPSRSYTSNSNFSEASSYSAYASSQSGRTPIVYVGGNDGMLHGFKASNGEEQFAYLPNEVFHNLWKLHTTDYSHKSYVDGPLVEGDVYFDSAWHTAIVGGLGLGGQGYYALDVTNPSALNEANAGNTLLWEFTDANDSDMGYSFSKPSIVRLNNGKWAAIFGNGINNTDPSDSSVSSQGQAAIFIVDIKTGSLIKKLNTNTGSADDPTSSSRPNGIMGIFPADLNNDFITDTLYATDIFGNLWVYDLSATNPNLWTSKYGNNSQPEPLYSAKDASGNAQSISTLPVVGRHPTGQGVIVYFGTGRYLGQTDITDTSTQSFYGIWDNGTNTNLNRDHLLEQKILAVNTSQFANSDARVSSSHTIQWNDGTRGWYMDLPESGERVHQEPLLRSGRIIFVTVTPSNNPCLSGGTSWLMELNASNGSRLDTTPFDYDQNGEFDTTDLVISGIDEDGDGENDVVAGSGIRQDGLGIMTIPAVIMHPDDGVKKSTESKLVSTSGGALISIDEDSDLNETRSWVELR
jgi:type IV pilus assembly protein PilY1